MHALLHGSSEVVPTSVRSVRLPPVSHRGIATVATVEATPREHTIPPSNLVGDAETSSPQAPFRPVSIGQSPGNQIPVDMPHTWKRALDEYRYPVDLRKPEEVGGVSQPRRLVRVEHQPGRSAPDDGLRGPIPATGLPSSGSMGGSGTLEALHDTAGPETRAPRTSSTHAYARRTCCSSAPRCPGGYELPSRCAGLRSRPSASFLAEPHAFLNHTHPFAPTPNLTCDDGAAERLRTPRPTFTVVSSTHRAPFSQAEKPCVSPELKSYLVTG